MYKQVFRRDEKKYLLSAAQKTELTRAIGKYIEPDKYFASTICSLYFDTPTQDLIIQSISKPVYKQKIRLRSYDVPSLNSDVFLEAKIKFRGIVSKRRFKIKLSDFYSYYKALSSARGQPTLYSADSPQIAKELDYLFHFYKLQPNWIVCYDRKSYCGCDNPHLRITFDENLRSRRNKLRLEAGDDGKNFFPDQTCVMEIKALDAMPLWLTHTLSELKIYPASFTKYGNIYKQSKKGIIC